MTTDDRWTQRLSEYLDDELTASERAALDMHLLGCAECARTLGELRWVTARARALDDRAPRRDLWPAIAAMVGSDGGAVTPIHASRRRLSFSLPQLAAAAVLLMVVSGGGALLLRTPARAVAIAAPRSSVAGAAALPVSRLTRLDDSGPTAQQSYDAAVADLQRVLEAGRGRLDTTTVRVLEKNLATIDSAVAEARHALEKDPANAYLNTYLAHTMRRKIDLLRQVAALTSAQS